MLRRFGVRLKPKREPTVGQSESPVSRHPSGVLAPPRRPTLSPTAAEHAKLKGMYPDMVAPVAPGSSKQEMLTRAITTGALFVVVFGALVWFDGGRRVFPTYSPSYLPSFGIGCGDRCREDRR